MTSSAATGASFLVTPVSPDSRILIPESFTEEQRQFLQTARQFMNDKVLPMAERIEKKDYKVLQQLLLEAGELGLLGVDVKEAHGGLGIPDKTTSMIVTEAVASLGAWSVTVGAQTGIGTMPIVWFGNETQKQKFLPKLVTGEWVSAYALTETGSGSDALGAKTKAVLSADGTHYVLNGSKQFITNAAFADVFIVFAKVDGEKFTGFIVEKGTPGMTVGPEEHKMGIRGSSTCPLVFEDARVPAENVLGEIGKGHKIAFNILNYGRLKLGAGVMGGMKSALAQAVKYAADRKQFGTPIVQFALIREKLARMATLTYATESMTYRTSGDIDRMLLAKDKGNGDYDAKAIAAIEEFAIEASVMKVFGSEALTQVIDDAVQIHGGYGYIEEFPVERAYRDQRINRIFEGTNEINRMLVTGMILKRTMKGLLPLMDFAQAVQDGLSAGQAPKVSGFEGDALEPEARAVEHLKWMAVYPLKLAVEAFGTEIEQQQELLANIADIVMDAYAVESMVLRTLQAAEEDPKSASVRVAMTRRYAIEALARSFHRSRLAVCAAQSGEEQKKALKQLATLDLFQPHDPVGVREAIAAAVESASGYPLG